MKKIKSFFARLPISFTSQVFIYPVILFAALIFAQLAKSPLSHMIFLFVLALPLITALYLVAARICIDTSLRVSEKTPEKKKFITVSAVVSSICPFPFPFVEAVMSVPDEKGFRLCDVKFILSLLPFSKSLISHSAFFSFRGEYDIRLSHLYVYDLSHSVRIRINLDKRENIFVMPRKISLPSCISNANGTQSAAKGSAYQKSSAAEPTDIRPYIAGDNPKHIHWKLSSKSENIIVREYADDDFAGVNIICDLEARYARPESTPERHPIAEIETVADLVLCDSAVECTLEAVSVELESGNTVFLSWISNGEVITVKLENENDFGRVYRRFACAVPSNKADHVKLISNSQGFPKSLPTVIVTPYIDEKSADSYKSVFSAKTSSSKAQILYCMPQNLFAADEALQKREKDIISSLNSSGIAVERIFAE